MLSAVRHQALLSGVTSLAQKVYGAVPITESWTHQQIFQEVSRLNISAAYAIVSGCLNSLIAAGLVNEPTPGSFRRVGVRAAKPKPEAPAPAPTVPPVPPVPPQEKAPMTSTAAAPAAPAPIDRIGALAARVAQMAADLKTLATDIGEAACDAQAQLELSADDSNKLRQLQAILKTVA